MAVTSVSHEAPGVAASEPVWLPFPWERGRPSLCPHLGGHGARFVQCCWVGFTVEITMGRKPPARACGEFRLDLILGATPFRPR